MKKLRVVLLFVWLLAWSTIIWALTLLMVFCGFMAAGKGGAGIMHQILDEGFHGRHIGVRILKQIGVRISK